MSLHSYALCIVDNKGMVMLERELACEIDDIAEYLAGFEVLEVFDCEMVPSYQM